MTIWGVVWTCLMLFWLFGYGMWHYRSAGAGFPEFGFSCLIPWTCVLILGLCVFGALSPGGFR
jgi:hypothetical protein